MLVSGRRLIAVKRRRESKWDIIHHEYHGPPAPLSKDGRVIDTPEVAEAKANHLAIHAETAAELARKMAESNAEEAKLKAEELSAKASPEAEPIVVAEPVQMTPELMAMLMAAAAEEQKQGEEENKEEPAPVVEAAAEVPKEPAPAQSPEAAVEAAPEQPAAEALLVVEAPKQEDTKVEADINNEVEGNHPQYIAMKSYEGPLAPLDHIGRVVETPEVKKAREAHFAAYRQAIELAKAKEEQWKQENTEENQETNKQIYFHNPPIVHLLYQHTPIGYKGPEAPLGKDGRVIDTKDVERAKEAHKKALKHAEAIAKRHPPKPEDNLI
ncbi:neurofilament medium polypeptide-like [Phymastichus coffea]|uniref:neurofilament medium polypeptide-like n=1 Tax=Phymastichus coffea TaxID=108790 RepID=UPI00273C5C8D|nr:neurofilament medium polypeptide-like [Phymastichus coffea]